jgi:DNA-binding transcriptional LysR family regulator
MRGEILVPELVIAGREIFLEHFGIEIAREFQKSHAASPVIFKNLSGEAALKAVNVGEAHIAIAIQKAPSGWTCRELRRILFVTVVGERHTLAEAAREGTRIPIEKVLTYPFVSPNQPIFGRIGSSRSIDGWRDDVHARKIAYVVESLSLFIRLIQEGNCIGYLPNFVAAHFGLVPLSISGCRFEVRASANLIAKRAADVSWLGSLVRSFGKGLHST